VVAQQSGEIAAEPARAYSALARGLAGVARGTLATGQLRPAWTRYATDLA